MRVMLSRTHPVAHVDPFAQLPCGCQSIVVHVTDGELLGDDLVECPTHRYALRLADLYRAADLPPR